VPRAAGQRFACFGSRTAVVGTAFAVLIGIGQGLGVALVLEGFVLVLAAAYYVWGGRDTDGGRDQRAPRRRAAEEHADEGDGAAGPGHDRGRRHAFVVAVVGKATLWPKADIWPYEVPALWPG
jgi:hypothetical protein